MGIVSKSWGSGVLETYLTTVLAASSEKAVAPKLHFKNVLNVFVIVEVHIDDDGATLLEFCRLEIPPFGSARVSLPNLPDGADVQALADTPGAINYLPTGGSQT